MAFGLTAFGAWVQHSEHAPPSAVPPEQLGKVNFPVSCRGRRKRDLFPFFWLDPAKEPFTKALAHDPACGMAYWGIAFMRSS
ncbi:hypothetical protein HRbin11_02144 [bacterium HR11]|nr:hypothetical protein HRbin11_02144 [bacterium HR11]